MSQTGCFDIRILRTAFSINRLANALSAFGFSEFFERRPFVHGQVIGLIALDQVLRLVLRGVDDIAFELDFGRDFLLDGSSDSACFRVPRNVVANFESRHCCELP